MLTVTDDRVTLKKSGDERLERVGTYGLAWRGGWGTAGVIVWAASGSVSSNEVIGLRRTDLQD